MVVDVVGKGMGLGAHYLALGNVYRVAL